MPSIHSYPTGRQYLDALYNTNLCFKDSALRGAIVDLDNLGMPKPISGNFASVFTVRNSNNRWAVKCFTRLVDHQDTRYRSISEALRLVNKSWRVEFDYLPQGVMCEGQWYPALKMEWIDAVELVPFIEKNLFDSAKLANVAIKFAHMVADLATLGIAHGDLQHGNLLVTSSGELKLIDYDGMYVPSLAKMGACEVGHADYQSPARTSSTWGPFLDNFSSWVIYASLVALTIDPSLWTLLRNQGDESLLFKKDDFVAQRASRVFQVLSQSHVSELRAIGTGIKPLWVSDVRSIPSLDPSVLPSLTRYSATTTLQQPIQASLPSTVLPIPDWVTQVQAGHQAGTRPLPTGTAWIAGHLAALPPVEIQPSNGITRWFAGVVLVVVVASAALGGSRVIPGIWASLIAGVSVVLFLAASITRFRGTAGSREKRSKLQVLKARTTEASRSAREAAKAERTRRDIDGREKKELARITKQAEKAKASEQKELVDADKRLQSQIQKLEKQRQGLASSELAETSRALRALQRDHVDQYLRRHLISSARIPGIGQGVVRSLESSGIRSAADFTGIQYQIGPRGGQQIFIRTRYGAVHPSGVGEKKASDLENWRRSIERQAMASQPSALPPAQLQAIRMMYTQQRQALVGQEQAARAQVAGEQSQIAMKWAVAHSSFSDELTTTRQSFARERVKADDALNVARKRADAAAWQRKLAEREVAAYRRVSYGQYLGSIVRR